MNRLTKVGLVASVTAMILLPVLAYGQTSKNAVTTTIGYFYSASGQMIDEEDNAGFMSSYLTRGERYDGSSETFAVSNIKDITADLDSNGNIINKYNYTAYGTQTSYTSNTQSYKAINSQLSLSPNPFTYDGYYTDAESGNYYLNARFYDPTLGIFLTSDSFNLPNRDMYVNGNPVMGVDPEGHFAWNLGCGVWFGGEHAKDGSLFNWSNRESLEGHENYKNPEGKQIDRNLKQVNYKVDNEQIAQQNYNPKDLSKNTKFIKQLKTQSEILNKGEDQRLYNNGYSFSDKTMDNTSLGGASHKLGTFPKLNDGSIYLMTGFHDIENPIQDLEFDRQIHVTPLYEIAEEYSAAGHDADSIIYVWKLTKETLDKNANEIVENGEYRMQPAQIVLNLTINDLYGYFTPPKPTN